MFVKNQTCPVSCPGRRGCRTALESPLARPVILAPLSRPEAGLFLLDFLGVHPIDIASRIDEPNTGANDNVTAFHVD
jgi:hypothetical protein